MEKVVIYGDYGQMIIDRKTGNVLSYEKDLSCEIGYSNILRVDINEHAHFWKSDDYFSIDILDVGFWLREGDKVKYVPPVWDYRRRMVSGLR